MTQLLERTNRNAPWVPWEEYVQSHWENPGHAGNVPNDHAPQALDRSSPAPVNLPMPRTTFPIRIRKGPYPDFRIEETSVNPSFISAVSAILKKLHYQTVEGVDTTRRKFFTTMKSKGFFQGFEYYLEHVLFKKPPYNGPMLEQVQEIFAYELSRLFGTYVMEQMTPEQKAMFFPIYDFDFIPHKDMHSIEVTFSALESIPIHTEHAYFSPSRTRIPIDGAQKVVAFNKHTLDRIGERIYAGTLDYGRTGSLHQRIQGDSLFVPCSLYGGQPAFAFWAPIRTGLLYRKSNGYLYLRELLDKSDSRKTYYYLLGYCPVAVYHGFAVAQTFMYPGFKNTPEYGLIVDSGFPRKEQQRLLGRVQTWEAQRSEARTDMDLVRWFHEHGVPQLMAPDTFAG